MTYKKKILFIFLFLSCAISADVNGSEPLHFYLSIALLTVTANKSLEWNQYNEMVEERESRNILYFGGDDDFN